MSDDVKAPFQEWMIMELYGHARIAGLVTEATIAGGAFLRVDVPDREQGFVFTRYYGPNAIYSMSPVTEAVCRAAAGSFATPPVQRYHLELPAPQAEPVAPPRGYDEDPDDDPDDEDE